MKLLLVTSGVPSHIGQIHIYNLLRALDARHEATVVCFDHHAGYQADRSHPPPRIGRLVRVEAPRRPWLRHGMEALLTVTPFAVRSNRSRPMARAIAAECAAGFDAVVFEQLALAQYFACCPRVPRLLFPVDAVSRLKWQRAAAETNPLKRAVRWIDFRLTRRYERRIYGKFGAVIFVSNADADYTAAEVRPPGARIQVLPNGVDLDYFVPGSGESEAPPSILFFGNLQNYINEHAALWFHDRVWGELKRRFPELVWRIVGHAAGPALRRLEADPAIALTGYVEDLRPHVWPATVVISPLQMGTGIKNRILQAMAMAKAIVASPLSVEGIEVGHGREMLVAGGAEGFGKEVERLLRDRDERRRLGEAARRFAERRHSLEAAAARFVEIVQAAAADGGRAHAV